MPHEQESRTDGGLYRHTRGLPALDSLLRDFRYAFRRLRREPGFAIAAVLILALGIGANAAVFSVVNTLLLRPLPFRDARRLVWIQQTDEKGGLSGLTFSVPVFEEFRRLNRSLDGLTAYFAFFGYSSYTLTGHGDPERVAGVAVAPDFFDVLGVRPQHGRTFRAGEGVQNGPRVVLLSHGFWQRRFAGDPGIVGQSLSINDQPVTVIGVMGSDFDFASVFTPGTQVDLYMPAILDDMRHWGNTLALIGRLKPGATVGNARADFRVALSEAETIHPEWRDWGMSVRVSGLEEHVSGFMRRPLFVLWTAVSLVLLIVCVNLANLMLARESGRAKETAVRVALGAGRAQLMRQFVMESLVLASMGAVAGTGIAWLALRYLSRQATFSIPLLQSVSLDGGTLAWTAGAVIASCLLFGSIPGLRLSHGDIADALRASGQRSTEERDRTWLRSSLVVAEIALACVLLCGAGLLLRSFLRLLDVDLGFRPSRAAALNVDPPGNLNQAQRHAFLQEAVRRVEEVPGVEAAGITDALPLDRNRAWDLRVKGRYYPPDADTGSFVYVVEPGFFRAMGTRLRGRDFNQQDTAKSRPVIVISESGERSLWPGEDALGRMVEAGPGGECQVVGIAADTRQRSLEDAGAVQMYFPDTQAHPVGAYLVLRTRLEPAALGPAVRTALRELDPKLPASDYRPIADLVERSVSPRRFVVSLLVLFAAFALLLASLGIYGVISFAVNRRTPEIGIRMALGASASHVRWLVIRNTLALTAMGLLMGLSVSLALARVISSLLFGISAFDPVAFLGMTVLLCTVALLAGYLPARRASKTDPMIALRAE